jgi:crotonobetainyl-CoA:carnitine CoA-transferase CaiB-like acyl-CoA transferase
MRTACDTNLVSYSRSCVSTAVGEHTAEILEDLGMSSTEVQQLVAEGVVKVAREHSTPT